MAGPSLFIDSDPSSISLRSHFVTQSSHSLSLWDPHPRVNGPSPVADSPVATSFLKPLLPTFPVFPFSPVRPLFKAMLMPLVPFTSCPLEEPHPSFYPRFGGIVRVVFVLIAIAWKFVCLIDLRFIFFLFQAQLCS